MTQLSNIAGTFTGFNYDGDSGYGDDWDQPVTEDNRLILPVNHENEH